MLVDYPDHRGVGRFEAERFVPEEWRPRVPNPAYVRSRPDDTFWAARKLMAFSDDLVRAAVRAGRLSDPGAEQFLIEALIARRDRIGRTFLTRVNPVVDPALAADGTLAFRNAAVQHGFSPAPAAYKAVWHQFDNDSGDSRQIGETEGSADALRAPSGLPTASGAFVRVDISAPVKEHPSWNAPVRAYFRRADAGWTLVGFDRMPDAPAMKPGLVGAEPVRK